MVQPFIIDKSASTIGDRSIVNKHESKSSLGFYNIELSSLEHAFEQVGVRLAHLKKFSLSRTKGNNTNYS